MLEFYTDKVVTAKKVHGCDLCSGTITEGEKYHRQSGKYYGNFFDRCLHVVCDNIVNQYCCIEDEYEYDYDGIVYWLKERHCCDCSEIDDCTKNVTRCEKIHKIYEQGSLISDD